MNGKSLNIREAIKILKNNGYHLVRQSGHYIFKNDKGDVFILPTHGKISQKTWTRECKKQSIDKKLIDS